ncbi:MAG: hypothetical protein JWR63_4020 [Conexibacter sp.]|nr:hypothetical protein [Conexibacter sp.]
MVDEMDDSLRPFPRAEKYWSDSADAHLPTLVLADQASDLLGQVLQAFELPRKTADDPGDEWFQTQALIYLGMLAGRSLRSIMALLRYGYDAEALVFKRRLSEAQGRVDRVVDLVNGGQQARAWLEGNDRGASAVVDLPDGVWHYLSRVAHADFRAAEQHLVRPRDDGLSTFALLPVRDDVGANGMLVISSMEVRDIAGSIATFKKLPCEPPGELDAALIDASKTYILDS